MNEYQCTQINELPIPQFFDTYVNDIAIIGHIDGTISIHNDCGKLTKLLLNPGQRLSAIAIFGDKLICAFTNGFISCVSLYHGIEIVRAESIPNITLIFSISPQFLAAVTAFSNTIHVLNREWLTPFLELNVESEVLRVFDDLIVCKHHIYKFTLPDFTLTLVPKHVHVDEIIDAMHYNHHLLLVFANSWQVINKSLEIELSVDSPLSTEFTSCCFNNHGVLIFTNTMKVVFLHHNNIQVLDLPPINPDYVRSPDGAILSTKEEMQIFEVQPSLEAFWKPRILDVSKVAQSKYILGQSDENVTAVYDDVIGYADGTIRHITQDQEKSTPVPVFPTPILKIDSNYVYSALGKVKLPVKPVNQVIKCRDINDDERVYIKMADKDITNSNKWVAISLNNYLLAEYETQMTPLHALSLTLNNKAELDSLLPKLDTNIKSIVQLENVVMLLAQSNCDFKSDAVNLLYRIWETSRVEKHLKFTNPRSLKLMAACYPKYPPKIPDFQVLFYELSLKESMVNACLWVAVYIPQLLRQNVFPIWCLHGSSHDSSGSGSGVIDLLTKTMINYPTELLKTLHETKDKHPKAVELVLPKILQMSRCLKTNVLFELVKFTFQLNHHESISILRKQQVIKLRGELVMFLNLKSENDDYAGVVFDEGKMEETVLGKPEKLVFDALNFSSDGEYVHGFVGNAVMGWKLRGGITSMYARHIGRLTPHIITQPAIR